LISFRKKTIKLFFVKNACETFYCNESLVMTWTYLSVLIIAVKWGIDGTFRPSKSQRSLHRVWYLCYDWL